VEKKKTELPQPFAFDSTLKMAARGPKVQKIMTQPIVRPHTLHSFICPVGNSINHSPPPPILLAALQNLIFRFLQNVRSSLLVLRSISVYLSSISFILSPAFQKSRIQIMLYENTDLRIEGRIIVRIAHLLCTSLWLP
jgi:hypothetical protein